MAKQPKWCLVLLFVVAELATACRTEPAPGRDPAAPSAGPAEATQPGPSAPADVPSPRSDGPVVLVVGDRRVEGLSARIRNGILSLYTGADPDNDFDEKIVFWDLPARPDEPAVGTRMTYEKHDASRNSNMQWLKDARFELKMGKEVDYKIPVTILSGRATDPVPLSVHGSVMARTADIEVKPDEDGDGQHDGIDRGLDKLDTIQWITREWIRTHREVQTLAERPDTCLLHQSAKGGAPEPDGQVAACSYRFVDERGKLDVVKLWLEKRGGAWTVASALEPGQILQAHPIKPRGDRPPYSFIVPAAQRFEADVYRPAGGFKRIKEPSSVTCTGGYRPDLQGFCEIAFNRARTDRGLAQADSQDCEFVTYLFEQGTDGTWRIAKALPAGQQFDSVKQQVVPRTSTFCMN